MLFNKDKIRQFKLKNIDTIITYAFDGYIISVSFRAFSRFNSKDGYYMSDVEVIDVVISDESNNELGGLESIDINFLEAFLISELDAFELAKTYY